MSTETPTDGPASGDLFDDVADREDVLALLEDAIDEAHRKACGNGRVYDPENERVRQGWLKTVGYLAGQYRQMLRDEDLEAMRREIDDLRKQVESDGGDP
jgi:cytochrome c556